MTETPLSAEELAELQNTAVYHMSYGKVAVSRLFATIAALTTENATLKAEIEFYADPWKWNREQADEESRVWIPDLYGELEFGERAARVLAGKEAQSD